MDASAGGGEECGNSISRRVGNEKPMKFARGIAGMEGGAGEFSYTRNSRLQFQSVNFLKPILEQEIRELEIIKDGVGSEIRLADFGCSVGANTLQYAEICYRVVCQSRLSDGRKSSVEVQHFFCDLPSNDFNTLLLQLEDWRNRQPSRADFYAAAVPGSFYGRLFPRRSLHVAISFFSLQWLSQVTIIKVFSSPIFEINALV